MANSTFGCYRSRCVVCGRQYISPVTREFDPGVCDWMCALTLSEEKFRGEAKEASEGRGESSDSAQGSGESS